MKEIWKKKSTKIAVAAVVIVVIAVISGIAVQSIQRANMVSAHMDSAKKYLDELDYEQAIAEYTAALQIDPENEKILDALEQAYLDMAQVQIETEEYDLAVNILNRGYEQLQRISLQDKRDEVEQLQIQKEEEAKAAEEARLEEERKAEEARKAEEERRAEEEKKKAEEEKEKEEEQASSETGKKQSGDKLETYKKKVGEYSKKIYLDKNGADAEAWFELLGVVVLDNTDTQCRLVAVIVPGGSPLECFEFTIDKTTDEGIINDYYYATDYIEESETVDRIASSQQSDDYQAIGRTFSFQ